MGKLKNKVILVTGAGRGIGKGCVDKLLSEEASVIATDRDEALLEESHRGWTVKFSKYIRIKSLDIASETNWIEVMSDIKAHEGHLHGLVNNAGILKENLIGMISKKDIDQTINTNLIGPINLTQLVSKIMTKKIHQS